MMEHLQHAQLHGQEDETYIRELKQLSDKPIIKAFSVKTAEDIEKAVQSPADYILSGSGQWRNRKDIRLVIDSGNRATVFSCRGNRCFEYETGDL